MPRTPGRGWSEVLPLAEAREGPWRRRPKGRLRHRHRWSTRLVRATPMRMTEISATLVLGPRASPPRVLDPGHSGIWAQRPRFHRGRIATQEARMAPPPEGSTAWPTELRLRKDKAALTVVFDTGEAFEFPAEFLRVHSPSAEVQGHSPHERKTVAGKRNVAILEVHPVGNYAVRLVFDDMHSTGIFSWDYFAKLGRDQGRLWRAYLDELAAKGLARDPSGRS